MPVNARAILLHKKALGSDELVDKILNEPESAEAKLYAQVKSLHANPLKKKYIEASLLASGDLPRIAELLELPLSTLRMYHDVYYSVEGLDRLSKMELLNINNKDESLLKLWALTQGLEFIKWRLGHQVSVSPVEGLQELFTTCIYKAKEAMFNGNTSESSKESIKWTKMSMDLARLLKVWVMDSAAAKKDIELALQEVVPEFKGLDSLEADNGRLDSDNPKSENSIESAIGVDINFDVSLNDLDKDD